MIKMVESQHNRNYSVILMEPKTEGNIGAIARICNNFLIKNLILISPQVDYLSETTRIRAKHSEHYLENAKVFKSINEVREKFNILIGTSAKAGQKYSVRRQPVYPWDLKELKKISDGEIGIVFGREDRGLSNEELLICDFLIHIPVPGEHKVLNLSHAVSIVLYELWKNVSEIEEKILKKSRSNHIERKLLFEIFEQLINSLDYEEYRKPIVMHTFRTVINRSYTSTEEIHGLIGVFKTILQRIEEEKK